MRRLILLSFALALFAGLSTLGAGCIYAPLDLGLSDIGKLQEVTLIDSEAEEKILLVRIDGEISDEPNEDGIFSMREGTVSMVKDMLDVAKERRDVRAVILRIDSPGGGVTASDVIYHEILKFKKESKKPVVALFMDTAASGGYYVAQAADRIVAHPTATTGSIGVIAMLPNVYGLGEKIGVEVNVVKSGPMKDMGNPFRPFRPEEQVVFQKLIDDMYAQFLGVVYNGRKGAGLTMDDLKKLADGRVYTAQDAKKAKLVDEIGYFEDAQRSALALAGLKEAKVVTYDRKGIGAGQHTIYSHATSSSVDAKSDAGAARGTPVVKIEAPGLSQRSRPVFYYLWAPGLR
jgi:protease-4